MEMRYDSAEILFQSFLWKAFVSSSNVRRDVRSVALFVQHFLCPPLIFNPSVFRHQSKAKKKKKKKEPERGSERSCRINTQGK